MRLRLASAALLVTFGCARAPMTVVTPPRPRAETVERDTADRLPIAVLRYDTPGLVRLSLFVLAGSRVAPRPAIATAAALAIEQVLGPEAHATVFPDAVEIALSCTTEALEACSSRLLATLALESLPPDAIEEALVELEARRDRAAADGSRGVEAGVLRALLGDQAEALFPLGAAGDDAPSATEIATFVRMRYRVDHAHLVATGDVAARELKRRVEGLASRLPASIAELPEADVLTPRREAHLVEADVTAVAVATILPDADAARATIEAFERAPMPDVDRSARRLAFVPLRGGTIVLVRWPSPPDVVVATRALARGLARAVRHRALAPEPPRFHPPELAARELGLELLASSGPATDESVIAAFATVPATDPGPRRRAGAEPSRAIASALAAALREGTVAPALEGTMHERNADATLANGARVVVRRTSAPHAAFALRFSTSPADEPADRLGASAILARVVANACRDEGFEVRPFVDATSFGVAVRHAERTWPALVDHGLACALRAVDADDLALERARLEQLAHMRRVPAREALASLGRAAFAAAPRWLSPEGATDVVGGLRVEAIAPSLGSILIGRRVTATLVGDVDPAVAASLIGSWLAALPAGDPLPTTAPPPAPEGPLAAAVPVTRPLVLVLLVARAPEMPGLAARAYGASLAAKLASRTVRVVAHGGDVQGGSAFAFVLLESDDPGLDALPARLTEARRDETAYREAYFALATERRRSFADPFVAVIEASAWPAPPAEAPPLGPLREASPHLVVGRPQPAGRALGAAVAPRMPPTHVDDSGERVLPTSGNE